MTRTVANLDHVELSTTIMQSDGQLRDALPSWAPTLAGEEDPFFEVEPSVIIVGAYAYPAQSVEHRRSVKRDRR